MSAGKKLRELMAKQKVVMAPGAYDTWSAKLVEYAGFQSVYLSGYAVSASMLGKPDIGLMSFSEIVSIARNMVDAVNIPVVADADNGYGGSLNVVRTVKAYEQAGLAAIQLEDQVTPKRCGHMEGKEVISLEEMRAKIKAAVYARKDPDFMIIARTDARAVNGFEDALMRARAYDEAGADMLFVEAPQSVDEMKTICKEFKKPLLANMVERGKTPVMSDQELGDIGFKYVIFPVSGLYCATKALTDFYGELYKTRSTNPLTGKMIDFPTFNKLIQLDENRALEKSFTE